MNEEFDWKTSRIALEKRNITPKELDVIFSDVPNKLIEKNQKFLRESRFVREKKGIFSRENFEGQFNMSGSFKVSSLEELGETKDFFIQRGGRFSDKTSNSSKEYLLRGPRYVCAIDLNLSVRQKLQILSEDAIDGINFLKTQELPKDGQFKTIAPVLDYIKNTAVTTLNAYIHSEKTGIYNFNDSNYQSGRSRLVDLVRKTSYAYYLSLLDSLDQARLDSLLEEGTVNLITDSCKKIKNDFEKHEFPSDALARPEASHPLVILGSVEMILSTHPEIETVVSVPSGSTEIGGALAEAKENLLHAPCDLILLPLSGHTMKKVDKNGAQPPADMDNFIRAEESKLNGKNVIILDDNASTGTTIEKARDAIVKITQPQAIIASVAEADVVRSEIDRDNPSRKNIAHPLLYDLSVSVLPVSRHIWPKYDLKKIMETKQLIKFYEGKIKETTRLSEKIKYEVFIDDLKNPTRRVLEEIAPERMIDKFQGTYLSNFYAVSVVRDGVTYPSVEHAYQSAKFAPSVFTSFTEEQTNTLSEILREKGYAEPVNDFSKIFTDPTIPSGITKTIANQLRHWGFVRADWDDVRIEIMIDLLVQKFNNPELREKLRDTGDLYLMEGNTWEDTLWGVCDGKGRNMLGRALMNIRGKIAKE